MAGGCPKVALHENNLCIYGRDGAKGVCNVWRGRARTVCVATDIVTSQQLFGRHYLSTLGSGNS
eukprot:11511310-Heterocapsa_arctica.AAC.1